MRMTWSSLWGMRRPARTALELTAMASTQHLGVNLMAQRGAEEEDEEPMEE